GTIPGINIEKSKQVRKKNSRLLPRFFVPVDSNVSPQKVVQIAFDLTVMQPDFKQGILRANGVPVAPNAPPDLFSKRAMDQSNGHLMQVLRKRPLHGVTQD